MGGMMPTPGLGAAPGAPGGIREGESARTELLAAPLDGTLRSGARNTVRTCLGLRHGHRFALIVGSAHIPIATALLGEAEEAGAKVEPYLLPSSCAEQDVLEQLRASLERTQASALVCERGSVPLELRRSLADRRHRHAHMAGITERMMRQSMRADFGEVDRLGHRLVELLRGSTRIDVNSATGTRLTIRASSHWHNDSGLLRQPGFTRLPGGEVSTAPSAVDGVVVPDGGLWCSGRELPCADRLRLVLEDGALVSIEGTAPTEQERLDTHLGPHDCTRRVSRVSFGTNIDLLARIGAPLQDLTMPGLHLTLGCATPNPAGRDVQVPVLLRRPDVQVDGVTVLVRGRFARQLV